MTTPQTTEASRDDVTPDITPSAATSADEQLFDPQFLSQLKSLFFRLRKRRQLKNRGQQPSPASGFTRVFKDHRSYSAGDDYRAIDWRLYARLDKLFIRLFEEVQELHVHVLIDTSTSMIEPYPRKRFAALRLAAALGYLAMVNQHRVSLMSLSENVKRELPPLKGQGHIHEMLARLEAIQFGGVTDFEPALRGYRPTRDRRGVVFVISDLFGKDLDAAEIRLNACVSLAGRNACRSHHGPR